MTATTTIKRRPLLPFLRYLSPFTHASDGSTVETPVAPATPEASSSPSSSPAPSATPTAPTSTAPAAPAQVQLPRLVQVSPPTASISGGFAPPQGQKVAAAPALSSNSRASLRAGIGLARTPIPLVVHAPGTTPYFPPEKPAPKVEVNEKAFQPWSFAVTSYGIHGGQVERNRNLSQEAHTASASSTPAPAGTPSNTDPAPAA